MGAKDTVLKVGELDNYEKACSYLIGVALSTGDGFLLRAIKSLMDNNDKSYKAGHEEGRTVCPTNEVQGSIYLEGKQAGAVNERERIMGIIEEYSLDKCSVRDDIMERQSKGWQALKENNE